ncbi:hypothetical protein EUX98_g1662 [Antrodiella citrinella]|uniref:ATP-dependent DNA helicase PIF1 n=1 Tax=Antrodiella citrinella TaxID=2447956 RepID=A0A4V3XJE3_9APHY|nr:hypothetical protein EUX98_g1662 [Antrodiella citrinella]
MSGLRSIKRDFSSSSLASSSQDNTDTVQAPKRVFKRTASGLEQRLKDIQAGLDSQKLSQPSAPTSASQSAASVSQKRPPPSNEAPAAKRRQLPSSWTESITPQASIQSRSTATFQKPTKRAPSNERLAPSSSKPKGVFLSDEQTHILKLVEGGQSVFYTGSAGTGKSVLLREIIKSLRKSHSKSLDAIAITASTGIAACNIGGVTVHSFSGIGLGIEDAEHLASKIRKNKKAMARWLRTKVLIIDEVSMVDGNLFDKLARIGSILRERTEPFGGIQLVVTGDFFQLPPVVKGGSQTVFAFEADLWRATVKKTFNLTKVFRQADPEFVDMLNEMRFGTLTQKSINKFRSLAREVRYDDGVAATELFPRREDVEVSNRSRMTNIDAEERIYRASEGGTLVGTEQGAKLLANFMVPSTLSLKVGAQVMLVKNMDETLVNGSMGTIVEFADPATYAANNEDEFIEKPTATGEKKIPHVGVGSKWPVVEFLNRRRLLVQPEVWKVELPNGEIQVSRTQLPLILSWAMSIHKSQGQTLERVKVDLAKVFEKGQAYVALSRATSLEGLQILHFDPKKVQAHPKVVEWSRTLQTIDI